MGQETRAPRRDSGKGIPAWHEATGPLSEAQAPNSPGRASVGEADPRVEPGHTRGAGTTAERSRDVPAPLSPPGLRRVRVGVAIPARQTSDHIRHGGVGLKENFAPVQVPPQRAFKCWKLDFRQTAFWAHFCENARAECIRVPSGPEGAFTCSFRIGPLLGRICMRTRHLR